MEKIKISVLERILAKLHVFLSRIKGAFECEKNPVRCYILSPNFKRPTPKLTRTVGAEDLFQFQSRSSSVTVLPLFVSL